MIFGAGCDLCQVGRMAQALESERFLGRVLTGNERARLEKLCPERRAERLAGMFAAKEAVAKALGTGFDGFGFADGGRARPPVHQPRRRPRAGVRHHRGRRPGRALTLRPASAILAWKFEEPIGEDDHDAKRI